MEISLSQDQQNVLKTLLAWTFDEKRDQYITVGGYAGTGKTTLASQLRKELHKMMPNLKVSFCAYTGKATRVLQSSLSRNKSIFPNDTLSTIHGMIYSPIVDDRENIVGWKRKNELKTGLIILDEASMVDENIWKDLKNYNVPIIAIGDHGQLPPINGSFNLMQSPILRLEQIHRQSENNPIIHMSMLARKEGQIPIGRYGDRAIKYDRHADDSQTILGDLLSGFNDETLILCGYNNTRVNINKHIRLERGYESDKPAYNDRVICLRNNHTKQIYNGMIGKIKSINEYEKYYQVSIEFADEEMIYDGKILADQFHNTVPNNFSDRRIIGKEFDLFDFGYALTVHKAQGSQAPRVILLEERFKQMDDDMWRRWLYTAVTRASEEIYILGD